MFLVVLVGHFRGRVVRCGVGRGVAAGVVRGSVVVVLLVVVVVISGNVGSRHSIGNYRQIMLK